ncbi:MAG: glycosyltransferase family 4 protein [Candidatus Hodarchaeales archaeon]|jgi:1,2-diacylglycerol-3-alpha-glucose alpha-1,2-glucosyltransferase
MKVNFILDMANSLVGSGVYNSAVRLVEQLKSFGIDVDINGKKSNFYDIYHFQTALPQSLLKAKLLARKSSRKYKILMTGHTTIEDFRNSFLFSNRIDFALVPYLTKYYSYADYLIAVSDYNKKILLRYGYDSNSIRVISNGIDLRNNRKITGLRHRARKKLGITDDQMLILSVGLCIFRKGPDVFSKVAALTPEHRFMWIGKYLPLGMIAHSSRLRTSFQQARNLSNINFTGYVSRSTLDAIWNAADIFLYVSREENQGIALLESIAYGLTPVVRDHPVFNWLCHNENCLKGESPEEFSSHIENLAKDKNLRKKITYNGQKSLKSHDITKSIKELADLYTELV